MQLNEEKLPVTAAVFARLKSAGMRVQEAGWLEPLIGHALVDRFEWLAISRRLRKGLQSLV